MAGTKAGGLKAAQTNKAKYGAGFYSNIGRMGGQNGNTGGFASDKVGKDGLTGKQRARVAGAIGGSISRRGASKAKTQLDAPEAMSEDFERPIRDIVEPEF